MAVYPALRTARAVSRWRAAADSHVVDETKNSPNPHPEKGRLRAITKASAKPATVPIHLSQGNMGKHYKKNYGCYSSVSLQTAAKFGCLLKPIPNICLGLASA